MKTGHLLYLSGMNREAFNTLSRRGHLDFLKRDVGEGVDRFRDQHALAIVAYAYLRRVGVEAAVAGEAVTDSWRDIMRIVGADASPVRSELCGSRVNHIGVNDSWGWEHRDAKGLQPIAATFVNLRMAWDWLQSELDGIKKQPSPAPGAEQEEQ